ncbi:MAG: amino acid ABC transporter permease [Caldilineae bacterium]|nr:MAG: amino acid ABC transporter permease [Caldilineae bacterium]
MTSAVRTSGREALPPPTERYTLLGWLQKNLFSNWWNSLLTLVSLAFLVVVLRPLLNWVFVSAEWAVIPANFNLIMRGQYPAEQAWRLWVVLYLLGATVGFSWGVISKEIQTALIVVFLTPLILMLVPFFSWGTRLNLLIVEIAGLVAYAVGRRVPSHHVRYAVYALTAFVVVMLVLLRGFTGETGFLPDVPTTLWGGLLLSLLLAFFGILLSFPIGVLLALGRQSKMPGIRAVSVVYIEFIRGVPLISLLFMAQVMLQLFLPEGFPPIDRVLRALAAIVFFSAAYTAENVRGGLQSIPKGQYEAAQAMGLNGYQTMVYIILPQALRAVIPVLVGQFIGLFKDTSLVALVGLFDLLGIARVILANPDWLGTQQEVYLFIALLYWIFSYLMSYASRRLEVQLGVGIR